MSEAASSTVYDYHEQTKHRFTGLSRGPDTLDWDAQPDAFRRYEGAPQTALPLSADSFSLPFSVLYGNAPVTVQPITLDNLALLLEMSLAVSAWKEYGGSRWALRCNPSSGNLHPTEAYLIPLGLEELADGVYHYRPDVHALEQRCHFADKAGIGSPGLLLGLTSIHWREAWKYGERAYRYCQLDIGHAMAAISYAAATLGWRATPHFGIADTDLAHLLGIDRLEEYPKGSELEHPDLLISLHPANQPPLGYQQLPPLLEQAGWNGTANILDRRHFYHWPVIDEVASAAQKPSLTLANDAPKPDLPPPLAVFTETSAATLFRRRRSGQAFDGKTHIAQQDFFRTLDHLLPRPETSPWETQPWPARIHPVIFAHRVEGLEQGIYVLPRREGAEDVLKSAMSTEFEWLAVDNAPPHLPLFRLFSGKVEGIAVKLSCGQGIAGQSAFSIAMLAEFDSHIHNYPWRYRELHWEAGTVGHVLYLEAEASELQGTGIGCFFDDGVHELLGISDHSLQVLYHFTVGGALRDDRIATLPAYSRE